MSRMQDKYTKEIAPALMEKFGYKSVMQIPKLEKVVINIGIGEAKDNPKAIEAACGDLPRPLGADRGGHRKGAQDDLLQVHGDRREECRCRLGR